MAISWICMRKFLCEISHASFRTIISHHFARLSGTSLHGKPHRTRVRLAAATGSCTGARGANSASKVEFVHGHPAPADAVPDRINVAPETSGASPRTCTLHAHLRVRAEHSHAHIYTCTLHAHTHTHTKATFCQKVAARQLQSVHPPQPVRCCRACTHLDARR